MNKELERLSIDLTFEVKELKRTLNELTSEVMELKGSKLDKEQLNTLKQIKQTLDELLEIIEGGAVEV
jgi:predicted RNA-binding protein with EMAP domain